MRRITKMYTTLFPRGRHRLRNMETSFTLHKIQTPQIHPRQVPNVNQYKRAQGDSSTIVDEDDTEKRTVPLSKM